MSDDLHYRLRDRSQRLWVTEQDLLDNLLFREAADRIKQLERYCAAYAKSDRVLVDHINTIEAKLAKAVDFFGKGKEQTPEP
jgi:hypothetical protein